jgi:PAS domain-containing protein
MKDNETTKQLLAELEASERQRQQLEESLKTLLNGYPAGTCVIQDGKFKLVYPQFENLSGVLGIVLNQNYGSRIFEATPLGHIGKSRSPPWRS